MPAPTALQRRPDELIQDVAEDFTRPKDDALLIVPDLTTAASADNPVVSSTGGASISKVVPDRDADVGVGAIDEEGRPLFPPSNDIPQAIRVQTRKVPIPPHRMTPLRSSWSKIYSPLVEHLRLQVRMNTKSRAVELRTSRQYPTSNDALQKGEDFIRAFTLGFDVDDAIALLRLDELYIETFEIKDVKTLQGDHLGRAIGRIAGKDGKTKFAIENTSRTRIVLADAKVHILGGFSNIRIAREAVVSLILGKPPGKVYGNLRGVAGRMKERF